MTTIDRDRLRRYLRHAAMLLPPDERVVTVAEGAAMLDALSAAEHRATRAEAQAAIRGRAVQIYLKRAREAEARIKAVRDVLAHHPYGGPDQEDAIRRALDAP